MAVKAALKLLNTTVKHADEVVESAGRGAARSSMIKNAVNTVKSNRSVAQVKNIANAGGEAAANAARREGINAAVSQVQARTAQRAINNTVNSTGSPVQHAKRIVDSKRVNQVIDGHNAQARQTAMDTIVNHVKDQNINRVPNGHQAARESVQKANEIVRSRRSMPEPEVNPMYKPKNVTYSYANNNANVNTNEIIPINRNTTMNTVNRNVGSGSNFDSNTIELDSSHYNIYDDPINVGSGNFNTRRNIGGGSGTSTGGGGNTGGGGGNRNTTGTGGPSGGNSGPKGNRSGTGGVNPNFEDIEGNSFTGQVFDFFAGGIRDSYNNVRSGQGIFEAINNAHRNEDGSLNMMRAAGTFMTASAAARVASGGGLYKDRYGNPNLIGVPFI